MHNLDENETLPGELNLRKGEVTHKEGQVLPTQSVCSRAFWNTHSLKTTVVEQQGLGLTGERV